MRRSNAAYHEFPQSFQNHSPKLAVVWDRTPRDRSILQTVDPGAVSTWQDINSAVQSKFDGEISVPELARRAGISERGIYKRLRKLKDAGLIYSITLPGKRSRYYINIEYRGPKLATPTPEPEFTPTPEPEDRGSPYLQRERSTETTTSAARSSVRVPADDDRLFAHIAANGISFDTLPDLWNAEGIWEAE